MDEIQNIIDGRAVVGGGEGIELLDPRTGVSRGSYPAASTTEVDAAIEAANLAADSWRTSTPRERQETLMALADLIARDADELAELEAIETGLARKFIRSGTLASTVDHLRFFAGAARIVPGIAAGGYQTDLESSVRREPLGVIAALIPSNYPLLIAIWKIGPAIAAGNTLIVKPSPTTPSSLVRFARLASDFLPPGILNVVVGGRATGRDLASRSRLGALTLTGSTETGRDVARVAAANLVPTFLELGGRTPVLVFGDADIVTAAGAIAGAALFNAGQDCTAPNRVLVHATCHDEFVDALTAQVADLAAIADNGEGDFVGPVATRDRLAALMAAIDRRPTEARLVRGGARLPQPGYFLDPAIVTGLEDAHPLASAELFGPVVTVQSFDTEEEAVRRANSTNYSLSASVWTADHARAIRCARDLRAGAVRINAVPPALPELPHGGAGWSGNGVDLSASAISQYSRAKHVISSTA